MPFDKDGNYTPPGGWAKDRKKKENVQTHPSGKQSLQMDDIDDDLASKPYTPVEPIAGPPAPEHSAADSMINYLDRFKTGAGNVFGAITDTVAAAGKNTFDSLSNSISNLDLGMPDALGEIASKAGQSVMDAIPDTVKNFAKEAIDYGNVSFDEAFQRQMNNPAFPQFFKDRINESPLAQGFTQPNIPGRSVGQDLGAGLRRWSDGQYNTVANTARMTGNQELGDSIAKLAPGSEGFEQEYKFNGWHSLYDPHWLAGTMVGEGVPSMLSFIPLALGGAEVGAAGASALGLGKVGTTIMRALGGTLASRPVESTMEAAQTYEQMQGTHEEKQKAANDTFMKNMAVGTPLDMLELSTIFMPKIGGIVSKLKLDSIGAKVAANAVMEGGEEGIQHWIQNSSQGKETSLSDPALHESMTLGGLLGGFSAGGMSFAEKVQKSKDAVDSIHTRAISKMDDETKADFQDSLDDAKSQGIPEEVAKTRLLETWANTPEGEQAIADSTAEIVESVRQADVTTMKMDGNSSAVESGQYMTEDEIDAGISQIPSEPAAAAPEVAPMETAALSPEAAPMDEIGQRINELQQEAAAQAAPIAAQEVKKEAPAATPSELQKGDKITLRGKSGSFEITGFEGSTMVNIRSEKGGETKVHRKAIGEVTPAAAEKQETATPATAKLNGNNLEIHGKPDEKTVAALQKNKFKFMKRGEFWTAPQSESSMRAAGEITGDFKPYWNHVLASQEKEIERLKSLDNEMSPTFIKEVESMAERTRQIIAKDPNANPASVTVKADPTESGKSKGAEMADAAKYLSEVNKGVENFTPTHTHNGIPVEVKDFPGIGVKAYRYGSMQKQLNSGKGGGQIKTSDAAAMEKLKPISEPVDEAEVAKTTAKNEYMKMFTKLNGEVQDKTKIRNLNKLKKFAEDNGIEFPEQHQAILDEIVAKEKTVAAPEQTKTAEPSRVDQSLEHLEKQGRGPGNAFYDALKAKRDADAAAKEEPAAPNVLNDHHARIKERAEKARQRIKSKYGSGGNTLNSGLPLDLMADLTLIGYEKILTGIADFKAWSDEMVKEAPDGERVRKWLPAVFAQANHIHSLPEEEVDAFIDELLIDAHGENPDAVSEPVVEKKEEAPKQAEKFQGTKPGVLKRGTYVKHRTRFGDEVMIVDTVNNKGYPGENVIIQDPNNREEKGLGAVAFPEDLMIVPAPEKPAAKKEPVAANEPEIGKWYRTPKGMIGQYEEYTGNHSVNGRMGSFRTAEADVTFGANIDELEEVEAPANVERRKELPRKAKAWINEKGSARNFQVTHDDGPKSVGVEVKEIDGQLFYRSASGGGGFVDESPRVQALIEKSKPQNTFDKLFFALSPNQDEIAAVKKAQPKNVLLSFARWGKKDIKENFLDEIGYRPENIIVDSGAFTFKGKRNVGLNDIIEMYAEEIDDFEPAMVANHIRHDLYASDRYPDSKLGGKNEKMAELTVFHDYIEFLDFNDKNIDYVVTLDDMLDPDASLFSFQVMKELEYNLMPVFHYGNGMNYLDAYVEAGADYIALGGSAKDVKENDRAAWANKIIKKYPKIKFHLLGTNNQRLIDKIPGLYSADGSRWQAASMRESGAQGREERSEAGANEIRKREAEVEKRKPSVGKVSTVVTERGTEVKTRFAIVDAKDLIASHTTDFKPNENYPQDIQPRDRERAGMQDQVRRLSGTLKPNLLGESPKAGDGAPIVSPELEVESGNGRTMALQMMYENHTAAEKKYREWLQENASEFGFKTEDLPGNPVLIRIRETDMTMEERVRFAHEANESNISRMSATERAQADAAKLTGEMMDLFSPGDEGNIMAAANREFVQSFVANVVGPNERTEVMDKAGALSQDGINRIKNAIFAKAYGNTAAIERLVESTDNNVKTITNALLNIAPRMASLRSAMERGELYQELDPAADIIAATEKLSSLRDDGQTVEFYMSQGDIFGSDLTDETKNLLVILDSNKRSAKKIGAYLNAYLDIVEVAGDPNQLSMFGDNVVPTKIEAQQAALQKLEVTDDENQITLWSSQAESGGPSSAVIAEEGSRTEEKPTQAQPDPETGKIIVSLRQLTDRELSDAYDDSINERDMFTHRFLSFAKAAEINPYTEDFQGRVTELPEHFNYTDLWKVMNKEIRRRMDAKQWKPEPKVIPDHISSLTDQELQERHAEVMKNKSVTKESNSISQEYHRRKDAENEAWNAKERQEREAKQAKLPKDPPTSMTVVKKDKKVTITFNGKVSESAERLLKQNKFERRLSLDWTEFESTKDYGYDAMVAKIQKEVDTNKRKAEGEAKKAAAAAAKEAKAKPAAPAAPSEVIEQYKTATKKIKTLEYNLADIHAQYELLVNHEAEIKAHFLDLINNHEQHKRKRNNTKAELVERLYKDSLDRLGYADSHLMQIGSYYMGSQDTETHAQKIKKVIDKITDESIANHIAKQLAEVESHKKAMENPQTLDELNKKKRYSTLNEEEQVRFDELTAERLKDRKQDDAKAKAESKAAVEGVRGGSVSFDIREGKHTKSGETIWIASITERVDNDTFKELRSKIKALGGYYSNFKPNVGFIFKEDPTANLAALAGGETVTLDTGAAFEERQADKLKTNAEKLRGLAEGMQERINDLRRDRKTHTHRMASQAASAASEADGLERIQKVMFNISAAIESGDAKHLDGISARTHIETLDSILTRRVYELMQANNEPMNDRNGNRIRRDPKLEDINGMEYPKPQIPLERLEEFLDGMKAKKLKLRMLAKIDKLTFDARKKGGYLVDVEHYMTEMQELVSAAKDAGTIETTRRGKSYTSKINLNQEAQWINDYMMTVKRLQTMGIEKPEQLRAALREYLTYREGTGVSEEERKRRELKQREGEVTRSKIAGFFPTPTPIVENMVESANIEKGMRVLEPSAGKGNIAEVIKDQHGDANLEVIEYNNTLRAILEDKGFNVVSEDFLEHTGEYDRIIMNPPFEDGQDIDHVRHAYDLLAPGGRIVAIMSEGPFYRSDKKAAAFRDWLEIKGGVSEPLEEGAFKSSERPTGVRTRIVTIDKGNAQEEVQKKIDNFEKKIQKIDDNPLVPGNERFSNGMAKEIMENEISKLKDQLFDPSSMTVDQVNDEIVKLLDERNDIIKQRTEAGNNSSRQRYDELSEEIEDVSDDISALRELLIERGEAKYPEALPLYKQYRDVLKQIDKLEGRSRNSHLDQVAKMFHLGTVGGAQHGNKEMRKLNKKREAQMEKDIELSKKLRPFYDQRSRLEVKINNIERGKTAAENAAKAKIREEVMNAQVGDTVLDSSYGEAKVIRVNQKTLTIETPSGFKEARSYDLIIRVLKKKSAEETIQDRLRGQQRSNNMGIVPGPLRNDRPSNNKPRMNKFESSDPEVEARLKKAVYRPPGVWDKIKEWLGNAKRQITREFQHLPHTKQYAKVRFELHRMQKAPAIAQDVVLREYLTGITRNLNKEDYELMMRIVVLRDLKRDYEREVALKFGYTIDVLETDLANLEEIATDNPKVTDAIDLRNQLFKDKSAELVAAYAKIDIDVSDKFHLENYLRHLVLEYVNGDRQISAAKKTVKARTNSGYMKKRDANSGADFVVDILTADAEVLTSMITDMQTAEVLSVIMHDPALNKKNELKAVARQLNQDALDQLFQDEIDSEKYVKEQISIDGEEYFSPLEVEYQDFAKRIAIGMSNLSKLAVKDELWTGENGEYASFVDQLKKRVQQNTIDDENSNSTGELFKYLSALLASGETGASPAGMVFKAVQERKAWVRAHIDFKTWENIIPEGYSKFEPAMGSKFYPVQEIDVNKLAKDLAAGLLTDVASVDDLQPYLETAFKKAEAANVMVIPDELGATLIDLSDTHERSSAYRAIKAANNFMKKNLLFAAPRFIQYEIRNFSSDVEKMFANKPTAFKYLMSSTAQLYGFVAKDHAATNDEVRDFAMMGGMQTLYGVAELGDLHKLEEFTRFYDDPSKLEVVKRATYDRYWRITRRVDTLRETAVRFSLYRAYLDELNKNGGKVKDYGSSVPDEVDALNDNKKKAFLMANDALIDYSKTSHLGRRARDTVVPFWSFTEGNTRSTYQWMKNVIQDKRVASAVGRKLLGKAVAKTPYYAYKVGKAYVAMSMLTFLLYAWNHGLHDDEEEELPEDIRNQLHIIWGRDSNGNIAYTSGLGAAEDFFKWVGMDDLYSQMMDMASGRRTFGEVVVDILKQPVNKIVGLVNPIVKNTFEGITGTSTYPDVFTPGTTSDGFDDKMVQLLGLGNEYKAVKKAVAGVPTKSYDPLAWVATLKNPGENAYYEVKDLVRDYKKRIGAPAFSGGGERSGKSEALFQYKQALKFGDEEAADRYLTNYVELGGTADGIRNSLEALNPLSALSSSEMGGFLDSLTPADEKRLDRAMDFFTDTLLGNKPLK